MAQVNDSVARQLLAILTLTERAARNARETMVMQFEATAQAQQPQLAIAGAAVLDQIQRGDARVLGAAQQNPAAAVAKQMAEVVQGELNNLVVCVDRMKVLLSQPPQEEPHQ